MAQAFDMKT